MIIHLISYEYNISVYSEAFPYLPRKFETIDFEHFIEQLDLHNLIEWYGGQLDWIESKQEVFKSFSDYLHEVTSIEYGYDHNMGTTCITMRLTPFIIENGVKAYPIISNNQ